MVSSLLEMLYSLRVRQRDVNRICWIPSKRSDFEVRLYFHVLTIRIGLYFPWKIIRELRPHSRVMFFVWMTMLEKILILDYCGGLVLYVQEQWRVH